MYIKEKIPKAVRTAVWNNFIGNEKGVGKCYVGCGEQISQNNFECGHVISEKCGGKVILDNLRPICSNCNKSMGQKNMEDFIVKYNLGSNDKVIEFSYNCVNCNFKSNDQAKWHEHKKHHNNDLIETIDARYKCINCNFITNNNNTWYSHLKSKKHKKFINHNNTDKLQQEEIDNLKHIINLKDKLLQENKRQIEELSNKLYNLLTIN